MIRNGVLQSFEIADDLYAEDLLKVKEEAIRRHGMEEWRKVVLTNEIHGHLGIYSTLGAKMGVYALSILAEEGEPQTEQDREEEEPEIVSFAGLVPPVSCMNDGLQISTGATIGHGLIRVSDEPEKRAEALFRGKKKCIRVALKESYRQQIEDDIRCGVAQYGHTASYWQYVRELAIRYWLEWDRNEIFEVWYI